MARLGLLTISKEFSLFFSLEKLNCNFSHQKTEHIESYHLIQSFAYRCFRGHKLDNTNLENKSKTQVQMTKT